MEPTTGVLPPMGNTGVEQGGQGAVRPDWLHGTAPVETYGGRMSERWSAERVATVVGEFFPGERPTRGRGGRYFGAALRGHEFVVMWEGVGDARERIYIEVQGEGWSSLGSAVALELLRLLTVGHRFRATRFDLCRDVVGLAVADLIEAAARRQVRTRAQTVVARQTLRGARRGRSLEVGARESDRFVRLYDYRGPTRIEVELKRGLATSAVKAAIAERSFVGVWSREVRAAVGFPSVPAWADALGGESGEGEASGGDDGWV